MSRYICNGCNSRFFVDEEMEDFKVEGQYFCSHCFPKVRVCCICGKIKVMKNESRTETDVCPECKLRTGAFPNKFLSLRFAVLKKRQFYL